MLFFKLEIKIIWVKLGYFMISRLDKMCLNVNEAYELKW